MPKGDKSAYTDKQKRKAAHIAEGYEEGGVSEKDAEGGVSRMRTRLRWAHCSLRVPNLRQRGSATQPERLSGDACMFGGRRDGVPN